MQNLIVSLNENILKISVSNQEEFITRSAELSKDVAIGSAITNIQVFSEQLNQMVGTIETKDKKFGLSFIVEPEDVILKFITSNKKNGNGEESLMDEVRSKMGNLNIEEFYFSYHKIAPFVYQFVAMKKDKLDTYLEISNLTQMPLRLVTPWILLLPKMVANSEPCIFVSRNEGKQVVALSELNGIYFCESYDEDKNVDEIEKLVSELSVYNRHSPITKVYVVSDEKINLDARYKVVPLIPQGEEFKDIKDFEMHALLSKVLLDDAELPASQENLLNMLPLPVVQKSNVPMVAVGAGIVAVLLLVSGLGYMFFKNTDKPQEEPGLGQEVLSETVEVVESAESTQTPVVLERKDLSVMVLNGAGIPGIAGETQKFMEEAGYTVVGADNAETQDYTNTVLQFKPEKKEYAELVQGDMKDKYTTEIGDDLPADSEYDLLVTVGS